MSNILMEDVVFAPPVHHISDVEYSKEFMQRITRLRGESQYTDVVLKAGDKELPCHRVVLAAASEYFNGMFSSGLEEASSKVIEIKGTDAETLSTLIQYIYSAEIQITTENVQNLVQASDQFQFNGLKKACEDFMLQQIAPSNCIGFYKFTKLYPLKRLRDGARQTMMKKFAEVVRSNEFRELCTADVIEYISDVDLKVENEDPVFEAVLMWVNEDRENRAASFPEIAPYIRLPFCTSIYLCRVVVPCPLMADTSCQHYLEEARTYHMLPDHRHEMCTSRTVPRCCFSMASCLVIVGGLNKEDHENRYSWYLKADSSCWELLAQLPRPAWKFYGVGAIQSGIVVSGGYYHEVKKDCWLFDIMEKKWKPIPQMTEGRCKHGSVVHNGCLHVIGGEDDFRLLKSVERYSHRQRQWTLLSELPKGLSDPLTVSFGQYIYVLSGIEGSDATSTSTFAYHTVWGEWEHRQDMPDPVRLGAAATVNDKIYVVGGYTRSCMSYDPKLDIWTTLTPPREKHGNAPATVWRGRILVGGGDVDSNETTSVVEEYDPEEDAWSYWAIPLKEELSCHNLLNIELYGI